MAEKPKNPLLIPGLAIVTMSIIFIAAYRLGRAMDALDEVKPGDTAPIPGRSSLYDLVDPPEDAAWCVFVQGALVTAVEVSEKNVLASYQATGTDERECPNNTKFVISKLEFVRLEQRYEDRKAADADRQELLRHAQER